MPFENLSSPPSTIAVIGGGISGMGAAYLLSQENNVTVFEKGKRLGGHARTVVAGKNGDQPVDTGFIVFNYPNYPNLTRLFDELDVQVQKSDMSFGVSADNGRVEYSTRTFGAVFAQTRNMVKPAFYRMLRDIIRFNAKAVETAEDPNTSIEQLLEKLNMGQWFKDYYLLPISGAIWSTPLHEMMSFPAKSLVQFFQNHNLLAMTGQHQWYTVTGGSEQYVDKLGTALHNFGCEIRLDANVQQVRRTETGVLIRAHGGDWERFDQVIFACHSDEALAMLENPSHAEASILGRMRYQDNRAVLHCDPSVMPRRKTCWSSWVYSSVDPKPTEQIGVTYWMNKLQSIPNDDLLLGSLNPGHDIKDELIYDEKSFRHPLFDNDALRAKTEMKDIQGQNNTWYCGAYLGSGFHEDGMTSAVDIAKLIQGEKVWA